MVASSSLDGEIRIWTQPDFHLVTLLVDIDQKKNVNAANINGIREMDYSPDFSGNLVSVGYSNYINLWSPDSSLSKSFIGRLEGHSAIVISCRIFPHSPHCISVDEKGNIKVWDLRNLMTIQTIRTEGYPRELTSKLSCEFSDMHRDHPRSRQVRTRRQEASNLQECYRKESA